MAEIIAKRYGTAFYNACEDTDIKLCLAQLGEVCSMLSNYIEALKNPVIGYEKKQTAIVKALSGYDARVVNLVLLLIKNNHIDELKDVYEYANRMYMDMHNVKVVKVVSARPLNAEVLEKIHKKLNVKKDYIVKIENEVDPRILGGFQLKLDNRILDLSVVNRLREVKKSLQNVDVSR
ncbi:F-type H+-transporting ATPase subunit delta [Caldanaerobius fijiensis DSM 17918]|uniref:ATP synthase subunit delta n=1 Tax=Caldanaerobius fijiensis DSM 17918 TaxID=1121256 RepID=A0A1M4XYL5_9THEO|nr:ATP synthase F1 subunit delta [Caldanaerobius fijiensis]SHE98684.1 F-type H+-transporting ATPase subunit delta [Caldanaerobius fijiensis DSM 17918]